MTRLDLLSYSQTTRVTDGAWGTQLQLRGLAPGAAPELWNADNPRAVQDVARGYVQAGSEIILTNTFGANRFVLAQHGLEARVAELAEKGAALSRRAAGDQVKVFGSLGPTGKIVMMQEVKEEQIEMAYAEAAAGLVHGGVDGIVLETFNELDELEIAICGVRKATDLPIVACMTFASGPDRTATMMGNTPGDLARAATQAGADAVGANCGLGPDGYVRVCEMLRAATAAPVWIKANAGLPEVQSDGSTLFPMGPDAFAEFGPKLRAAGAGFVGGCCGTAPDHIRALRRALGR